MKKSVLLALATLVLLLATGGEHANMALEAKAAKVKLDVTDDSEDKAAGTTELSIDIFNSVIQVSHLIFHSDLSFEFDLPELSETKAHPVFYSALYYTKYFRTLFRAIISPNAP